MTLLEFAHVSKRYGRGSNERVALHDVSLRIDPGELVAVWGRRRSGRSTLLRIAAGTGGILTPGS
jgi:ABC-type lipoprotein export system ATPase subunit